jgi:hypothetical protein
MAGLAGLTTAHNIRPTPGSITMTNLPIRKIVTDVEEVGTEHRAPVDPPVRRAWAAAVLANPCKGLGDLAPLMDIGAELGNMLGKRALDALGCKPGDPVAYGKCAIVGANGALEHAAAVMRPKLGRPLRNLIQQGKALTPSAAKRGAPGARIDIPSHGANNEWAFEFVLLDAIAASVPDAPLPDEIVVFVALSHGGRPATRIGRQ